MKKLMSLILVFTMLLTFCACDQNSAAQDDSANATEETQAETEETLPFWYEMLNDPDAVDYDSIDENVPNEQGEYQIHTAEGLKNLAKYPDAKFKILRDIDMEGAQWTPVENFTGTLNGQTFKIKNFTISTPTADGNLAFIGVNEGTVINLILEDITVIANDSTVNAAGFVAVNEGIMRRNGATGTLVIDNAANGFNAGGAVAINKNLLEAQDGTVTITCSAAVKGNIGGLVGVQQGGKLKKCTASGNLYITNTTDKSVGIFCGSASNVALEDNGFAGTARQMGDEILQIFCGTEDAVTNTGWALRDPVPELPANIQAKRERVVQEVYEMANIVWTVSEPLTLSVTCACCTEVTFVPGISYRGIPYAHKNSSLTRFKYYMTEDNVIADWCYDADSYDGWDVYIGNDCSTGFQQALAVVCNDCDIIRSKDQFPGLGHGTTIAVGNWAELSNVFAPSVWVTDSTLVIDQIGEEAMLECYAQLRLGDGLGSVVPAGGHSRMVTSDPVVMRDETGKIDPEKSYLTEIDQVASFTWVDNNSYISSWRQNKYTFSQMLEMGIVPLTWEELITDEPPATPEVTVEETVDGRFGLTTGIVTSNVYLDSVSVVVTDEAGNEVFNHRMFTNAEKRGNIDDPECGLSEDRVIRQLPKTFDLLLFATPLRNVVFEQGKTYTAQIIAHTNSGFDVIAREFAF